MAKALHHFRAPVCGLWACVSLIVGGALFAGPVPPNKPAVYPAWWFERDVLPRLPSAAEKATPAWPEDYVKADDFAAANQGQARRLAKLAYDAMKAAGIEPGAALDERWADAKPLANDTYALNIGQLKALAAPFHERLKITPPWGRAAGVDAPADDHALANLGQLKRAFAFPLPSPATADAGSPRSVASTHPAPGGAPARAEATASPPSSPQ